MYTRYFLPGQKVLLKTFQPDTDSLRIESVNTRLVSYDDGRFELSLVHPWQINEPFFASENQEIEIISERFGIGLRSTGSFRGIAKGKLLRLQANYDLNLFRLKPKPRINTHIGFQQFSAKTGSSIFYRKWIQQIEKMKDLSAALSAPILPLGEVNISSTGLRAALKTPVANHDLCLMMLELHPDEKPICTLGEVVWSSPLTGTERYLAGLQFLNILKNDQERIEEFIKKDLAAATMKSTPARA
ncbi:MAG: PilZ domain-containing protein [Syntrophotaleaceae bacterium]